MNFKLKAVGRMGFMGLMWLGIFAGQPTWADTITLTVSITNQANLVSGSSTIANGADLRTWTSGSITSPATQIAIAANNVLCASNLFYQVSSAAFSGMQVSWDGASSNVVFFGTPPLVLTVSGSTWASLVYVTNSAAKQVIVAVNASPGAAGFNAAATSNQVAMASGIVAGIVASATNGFPTNTAPLSNFVAFNGIFNGALSNGVVINAKSISGTVGALSNGYATNMLLYNGTNFGLPFRSPGAGTGSEQMGLSAIAGAGEASAFGDQAQATAVADSAFGFQAEATGGASVAVGASSVASQTEAVALGQQASATGIGGTALGNQSSAGALDSTAVGALSTAGFGEDTAIGQNATTTAAHQIMLGTSSESVIVAGNAQIIGNLTNLQTTGTNTLAGEIVFPSTTVALVNGNNVLQSGTNYYIRISGPTGAFTIASITGGVNGRKILVENAVGQTMTIAQESGFDGTAANHIHNPTGADTNFTGNPGNAEFIYDGGASRWILLK